MDMMTLAGIVVAAVIMILGLVMMMRNKKSDAHPPADSSTGQESSEVPFNEDLLNSIPVVPRHARAAMPAEAAEPVIQQATETHSSPVVASQSSSSAAQSTVSGSTTSPATTASAAQPSTGATSAMGNDWDKDDLLGQHFEEQAERDEDNVLTNAETIIALYLLPQPGVELSGEKVLFQLREHGLRFGDMSLFHRFEQSNGEGPLMFSVLKHTDDGHSGFDLETLASEKLKGLVFFLALPNPYALPGFDMMVSLSGGLARALGSTVYDEQHNVLPQQLRDHYRQMVIDYN